MSDKSKSSFEALIESETPTVLDFYADWCGPCKQYAPILKALKNDMGDRIRVVKINVDNNQELSQALQVQSIPTTMIFQKGELKFRAAGLLSKQQLTAELEKYA